MASGANTVRSDDDWADQPIRDRLSAGRVFDSGPTCCVVNPQDTRAARMGNALSGVVGGHQDRLTALLDKLGAAEHGDIEPFALGFNDQMVTITSDRVLLYDDYFDGDLNTTEKGELFTHAELREGLEWWQELVDRWQEQRPEL